MSTEQLLAEREKTHGSFYVHASYTTSLKECMREGQGFARLIQEHQEALDMIAHKIGRILAGNPHCRDHWADIAGYALLAERACKKEAQHDL